MIAQPNRATRRKLEREVLHRVDRIEDGTARCEIIQLHTDAWADICYFGTLDNGNDFALRAAPYGLIWGEQESDGFCSFEIYGPDGEHLYGFGGDGYDLEKVVLRRAYDSTTQPGNPAQAGAGGTSMVRERNGKIWVCCPCCNLPLHQIKRETKAEHFPLYCRKCRKNVGELNI